MELWPETWKCSTAATACIFYIFPFPWAPNDFELPLSASLPLGIFWKTTLLTCKPDWMCQGMNTTSPPCPPCPQAASITQCLMRVGVYGTQLPSIESCVLYLSLRFSCGIKLRPPTVETGLLMYLLLSAFLFWCYFLTFFPVFRELSEKSNSHSDSYLRGLLLGEPKQRYAPILPRQSFSPKDS